MTPAAVTQPVGRRDVATRMFDAGRQAERYALVQTMREQLYTLEAIALVLGVSRQRVHQMLKEIDLNDRTD